ncbi:MAG: VanZ family protein [Rhodothermales bacterium]|nr:VanZ family protein [Rhodothermales bacterium]MBO6780799.1 VanZ family protein [Rhodothermales bacterium]
MLPLALFLAVLFVVPWLLVPPPDAPADPDREGRLWIWAGVVVLIIYTTLGPAQIINEWLRERSMLLNTVTIGVGAFAAVALAAWLRTKPGLQQVGFVLGALAAAAMAVMRVDSIELRTHLFEYGVVAMLIYQAFSERWRGRYGLFAPAAAGFAVSVVVGAVDEAIQWFLPNRVFDPVDIGFNAVAAGMVIGIGLVITWMRRRKESD